MTATAGALIDDAELWAQIDWDHVRGEVRRLQRRIAKAVKAGRWGRVKTLQHLLTHSFYAKLLAVKRVTSNT
jgi:RNA-directed DNA polymerase